MIVIKLGGSLYGNVLLKEWVSCLASIDNYTIIIVPGGGPFADQVRNASKDWDIDNVTSHNMAVLAMQQYAYLISSLNSKITALTSIDILNDNYNTYIWHPYLDVINKCEYPKSWKVTSDSIALWLAKEISAQQLILVKSANIDGMSNAKIIHSDIVDKNFPLACPQYQGELTFYNAAQLTDFINNLNYG